MTSLYIHVPFCQKKCLYCSFVVSIGQEKRMSAYADCLIKEFKKLNKPAIQTIYIGGGTPSYLTADILNDLFKKISEYFDLSALEEWTFELNPEDVNPDKLRLLKSFGINRISFGAQSMDDVQLKKLGRIHTASKIKEAYDQIRQQGFDNVNVDLMFSLPDQTFAQLQEDVYEICKLKSDHLSLYSLMIDENSYFFNRSINRGSLDDQGRYYGEVCRILDECGFHQYEISNFAKGSKESKHNINYWVGGNYHGIGVAAHSHIDGRRFWNESRLIDYMKKVQEGISVEAGFERLDQRAQFVERILLGLRMNVGVDITALSDLYHCEMTDTMRQNIEELITHDLLTNEQGYLKASDRGRLVLDEISAKLF